MMVFAFYLFAISVLVDGFIVVISRNPVHSVLWLILAFLSAAGLFVLPLPDWGHIGAWVVMAAAIVVTVATGIDYFFRAAKLRRESARTARARSTQS